MDGNAFRPLVVLAMVGLASIPLGLWKLVEIVWWLITHVKVSF